jgi:glycosyltransferase involved in cell wall biosynthesis
VLAADQGGLRDSVIDGITGFLLPPGDAAAWVQAITALRDWPVEGRAAFVGASTAAARQAFSWERVACETLSVYREPAPRRKRA